MAVSTKKAANERRAKPNLGSRKDRTRREGKCQLCESKVPIKKQYTVVNDLEANEPVARQNAGAKGNEESSHYCGECKDKRIRQKQAWLDSRDAAPKAKKGKAKKAAKKGRKAAPKKAAKKAVKKVRKPKGKKAAKPSGEAF